MATLSVVNSKLFAIYTGGTPTKIARLTNVEVTMTHEPRDISSKDDSPWTAALEGPLSWEASGESLVAWDDTNGADTMTTSITNRTLLTVVFTTDVTGDKKFSGSAYLTNFTITSPETETNVTCSFSMMGVGELVKGTEA
jgi:Phage tail tube protein